MKEAQGENSGKLQRESNRLIIYLIYISAVEMEGTKCTRYITMPCSGPLRPTHVRCMNIECSRRRGQVNECSELIMTGHRTRSGVFIRHVNQTNDEFTGACVVRMRTVANSCMHTGSVRIYSDYDSSASAFDRHPGILLRHRHTLTSAAFIIAIIEICF